MGGTAMMVVLLAGCASDPPNAQSFTVGRDTLTEGQSTEVTLAVSDPQGVEDLAGVTIVDLETGLTLLQIDGAPSESGEYVGTVSWDDFAALAPLDFLGEQDRTLQATFTDLDANTSGVVDAELTLQCNGEGGTGVDDKCFNITDVSANVAQACDDICGAAGFQCATAQAINALGEVGTMSFNVDNDGTLKPFVLTLDACDDIGSEQVFEVNGASSTLNETSEVDWVCNCRPL